MIDLQKFFLNFTDLVRRLKERGIEESRVLSIKDKLVEQKKKKNSVNKLRHKRNELSREGRKNADYVIELKKEITRNEERLEILSTEIHDLVSQLPNLPASDTPTNQEGNIIVDQVDYQHNIQHNLTHEQILKKLVLIDEEKSIKLSGSKFTVYQGFGSQLLHALINFFLTENSQKGYQLFDTPYLVNSHNLYNTGQFHKFQDSLYKVEDSNLYLLPTAEVSLVNLYQNQILSEEKLPLKLCAYSPCFRAERMAAGQENKGLIRLHQFHKVELVKIVKPENSYQELERLVTDARHFLHLLKIPHRVIKICHAELGFSAAQQYDLEVWLPISQKWLEISSCSNCEDFQSRRALIRVISKEKRKYYPHTLNGSALAIDRLIVVLCEYYYNEKENKLEIPEALKKFFWSKK